jgi:hypothetical protein
MPRGADDRHEPKADEVEGLAAQLAAGRSALTAARDQGKPAKRRPLRRTRPSPSNVAVVVESDVGGAGRAGEEPSDAPARAVAPPDPAATPPHRTSFHDAIQQGVVDDEGRASDLDHWRDPEIACPAHPQDADADEVLALVASLVARARVGEVAAERARLAEAEAEQARARLAELTSTIAAMTSATATSPTVPGEDIEEATPPTARPITHRRAVAIRTAATVAGITGALFLAWPSGTSPRTGTAVQPTAAPSRTSAIPTVTTEPEPSAESDQAHEREPELLGENAAPPDTASPQTGPRESTQLPGREGAVQEGASEDTRTAAVAGPVPAPEPVAVRVTVQQSVTCTAAATVTFTATGGGQVDLSAAGERASGAGAASLTLDVDASTTSATATADDSAQILYTWTAPGGSCS